MTLKNAVTKGVKAWRGRRVGYWLCIDPKTGEYYLLTSAALAELMDLMIGDLSVTPSFITTSPATK